MAVTELLQSVRFVVGSEGKPTDAIISIEVWHKLIEWIEDIEDAQTVRTGFTRLRTAGSPEAAGLIPWAEVDADLETSEQAEEETHARLVG